MSEPKRAIVLLSGGLDSATVLAIARSKGYESYALSVEYGQRHRAELDAAKRVAAAKIVFSFHFYSVLFVVVAKRQL